jgi:hypothetical protein
MATPRDRFTGTGDFAGPIEDTTFSNVAPYDPDSITRPERITSVEQLEDEESGWFEENLAASMDAGERRALARELLEYLDLDERWHGIHHETTRDAFRSLALTKQGSRSHTDSLLGGRDVHHPLLAEAMANFQARVMAELFPAKGPAKPWLPGMSTEEYRAQGRRMADYLNWQLLFDDPQNIEEFDQMFLWMPLLGTGHMVVQQHPYQKRLQCRQVNSWNFILPFWAKNLEDAPRYAWRERMSEVELTRAIEEGHYHSQVRMDVRNGAHVRDEFDQLVTELEMQQDGAEAQPHHNDRVFQAVHFYVHKHLPGDDPDLMAPPYRITVERNNEEVLRITRNYREKDELQRPLQWVQPYRYLPGLGYYGIGFLHVIGSLAAATSSSVRALLDSAGRANMTGGFAARGTKISGQIDARPGVWHKVDLDPDELQQAFYPYPFKEPSQALANLAEMLVGEGRRFASTTDLQVGDGKNTGPVGTTLALIEEGGKVQSAVHRRNHRSLQRTLKQICMLNRLILPTEQYPYPIEGRDLLKQDFDGSIEVVPVSDPNIWSNTQRIARDQGVVQLVQADPQTFGPDARSTVYTALLESMRVPDDTLEKVMPDLREQRRDLLSENVGFMMGKGTRAFPEQDHQQHIMGHQRQIAEIQALPYSDAQKNEIIGPIVAHIREHMGYQVRNRIEAQLQAPLPGIDPLDPGQREFSVEEERQITAQVAQVLAATQPPPPAPAKNEGQEEEAKIVAMLERKRAQFQQETKIALDKHDAEQRMKQQAFEAEERRKQEAHKAELKRQAELRRAQGGTEQ